MRIVLCILMVMLSGCETTGYVFGGLAYSSNSGFEFDFDETGTSGTYGAGVEFNDHFKCEFRHRSMANKKPEVVTNDTGCIVTVTLWGRQ